jgi:hypothetical protein
MKEVSQTRKRRNLIKSWCSRESILSPGIRYGSTDTFWNDSGIRLDAVITLEVELIPTEKCKTLIPVEAWNNLKEVSADELPSS